MEMGTQNPSPSSPRAGATPGRGQLHDAVNIQPRNGSGGHHTRNPRKLEELRRLIHRSAADVVCLAETKWRPGSEVQFHGFKALFNSRQTDTSTDRPRHGTAIYTRHGINTTDEQAPISLLGRYAETTLLLRTTNGQALRLRVGSVYAPTNPATKDAFFTALRQQIARSNSPIVLGGDFNSKISQDDTARDYEGGQDCTALADFINESPFPLHDVIKETNPDYDVRVSPTYTAPGYRTRIDHLLASFPNGFTRATIHSLHNLSANHSPITAHLNLTPFGAAHHPFHPSRPPPLLHIDTRDQPRAALFAEKCRAWEAALPPHLTEAFLSPHDDYMDPHLSDRRASLLEEALTSFTALATTTAAEVYPSRVLHQASKFNWKRPFERGQPAGDLLHRATWARRAIRAYASLVEHDQCPHLNTHAINHRLRLLANPPDDSIPQLDQAGPLEDMQGVWIDRVRLALRRWNREISREVRRCQTTNHEAYQAALQEEGARNSKDLRRLLSEPSTHNPLTAILDPGGELLVHPTAVLERLTQHFQDLGRAPTLPSHENLPWRSTEITAPLQRRMENSVWPERLQAPLSLQDVHDSIGADTAPGLDRVQYPILRVMPDSTLTFLRHALNTIVTRREIPASVKRGEVVLLHKGGSPLDINNYRGIYMLQTYYKLITSTIARRLTAATEDLKLYSNATGGSRPGRTCGHKTQLLTNLLAHARRHQKPIYFVLVDIAKAYPSTPFIAFLQALRDIGCPPDFVALHDALQTGFECSIRSPFGHSPSYPINNGCKEGCGASPGKYISYMDMYFRWLDHSNLGYHFTLPDGFDPDRPARELIIPSAGYVDDTGLFSDSLEDCQKQIDMLTAFLQAYGQRLNPAKSTFAYWTPDGVPPPSTPTVLLDGLRVPLPTIEPQTPFRYLGYWISMDGHHHQEAHLGPTVFPLLHRLSRKRAPFFAKANIINADIYGKITYAADVVEYSEKWVGRVQTQATRALLHPVASASVSHRILTGPTEEIGFSITDLWAACQARLFHGLNTFLNGRDTECATTTAATLFALQRVLYTDRGAWQGPPPRSEAWTRFPHGWQAMARTAHRNGFTILQRDAQPTWHDLPLQRLFSLAGFKQQATYPLLSTLRAQGITTADQISCWFRRSPAHTSTPIEDALLLQQRAGDAEYSIMPASEAAPLGGLHGNTRAKVDRLLRSAITAITASPLPLRLTSREDYWRAYRETQNTRTDSVSSAAATDGSFNACTNSGGAAVVTPRGPVARARVLPCSSSTHAELVAAALGACFVTRVDTTTHIDSTSAIQNITGAKGITGKHRDIVRAIHWLAAPRSRTYSHVKAHTDSQDLPSRLNRAADLEAKAAATGRPTVRAPDFTHFLDPFIFCLEGKVLQDRLYTSALRHLTASRPIPPSSHSGHMFSRADAWRDPSLYALRAGDIPTRTFAWKLVTRTLPTLAVLHRRRPDIYATDRCPTCPAHAETGEHVFLACPAHREDRAAAADRLAALLRHHDPNGNASPWLSRAHNDTTLSWDPGPVAAALIPATLQHQLSHLDPVHATSVARQANQLLVSAFKAIWASRCATIRLHGLTWAQLTHSPHVH